MDEEQLVEVMRMTVMDERRSTGFDSFCTWRPAEMG